MGILVLYITESFELCIMFSNILIGLVMVIYVEKNI